MSRRPLTRGSVVRIRQERWRVSAEWPFDRVSIVEVDGCDATNSGTRTQFIRPFDHVDSVDTPLAEPRFVTLSRWRRGARATLANAVPAWASLRAAARARLTVLPFQLEPAIAVTRGDACRILIADEVGLGKTVQAGLIVAECVERVPDARVLVISPAGLRDQWREELQSRFGLAAPILDAEGIARVAALVAAEVNPWGIHRVAITSIDYVKRPEVMRSLEPLTWDVLVFDEAHALAGRSDRASAAASLARRARTVVLLTATPHTGDAEAFARLTAIGDLGDAFPLATFRRTRSHVGLPHGRRLVNLRIRPTPSEMTLHRSLDRYIQRLADDLGTEAPGIGLLAAVLTRRAYSSASSLARSLERRMNLLGDVRPASLHQDMLPFGDGDSDEEPAVELAVPGLRNEAEEQEWLRVLAELARSAAGNESKCGALARLLRRAREPALVFTEYRDTLERLARALTEFRPLRLHGGLSARERNDVLRRFTCGEGLVLLATDAASEGLNLHHRCRLVVNLELPWTPLRLEQRIGRVDRLGQSRRVHAVQLVGGGTREESLALRLHDRASRIDEALSLGVDAALHDASDVEANRVRIAKCLATSSPQSHTAPIPFVTSIKASGRSAGAIWAVCFPCIDSGGQTVCEAVAAFRDDRGCLEVDTHLRRAMALWHAEVLATNSAAIRVWVDLAMRREEALLQALRDTHGRLSAALLQPGLFDRRAERAATAQEQRVEQAIERARIRLVTLRRWRAVGPGDPTLLFGIGFRR